MLGGWGAAGLDSQEWQDYRASQATPQRTAGGAGAANAPSPPPPQRQQQQRQQQHGRPHRIMQIDGAADSMSAELSGGEADADGKNRFWLPAPVRDRPSLAAGPRRPMGRQSALAAGETARAGQQPDALVQLANAGKRSAAAAWPEVAFRIPQVDGAADQQVATDNSALLPHSAAALTGSRTL